MAVTNEYEIQVGITYANAKTRTYSIGVDSITAGDPTSIKTRINEVRNGTGTGGTYTADAKATFVSDEGSPMADITSAKVVTTASEVIYNG